MNIGLVLSGGMAKGAYQIGALKALNEYISPDKIQYVSSASVGVLNSYAFVTNKLLQAEEMWKKVCSNDNRLLISKILRSSFLQNSIDKIYSEKDIIQSFFYISLLNFNKKEIVYMDLQNAKQHLLPDYLKASVAMPIYNRAVSIGEDKFFDGALVDNIPVFPFIKHNLDYIICIYFDEYCYKFENTYFDNKIIKITFPIKNMLKDSVLLRKDSINDMVTQGYQITSYILQGVFAKGLEDLEYIYDYIKFMNCQRGEIKLRITGDMLVTNINKVTQKLAKRKITV